jgi:putative ABC transport system permease protein
MIFWTIVKVAFKSLAANKLRSLLAMLGIIIAVWSVISALALAAGAQQSIMNRISAMGTNLLMVSPGQRGTGGVMSGTYQTLKVEDAEALLKITEASHVAPVVRGSVQVKYLNKNTSTSLLGSTPTYLTIRSFSIASGRGLSDVDCDSTARVAVIGVTTAANLFGEDYSWCIGQSIQVKGVSYRVIGLLESKGDQGWFNPDNQVIIPYTTAMKQVLGVATVSEIDIRAEDEKQLDLLQDKVTDVLRKRHHLQESQDNDFNVRNQADAISTANSISTIMSAVLGGIAGISLLVGGIGIMNIMLVSVAERTREIGIRKAIGAKQRDILSQFLIEALVMSGSGGFIGLVLAYVTSVGLTAVQDNFVLVVQPMSVVLAMGFSLCVGVFFGYYPARRAARLDPIEALRYE